MQRRAFFGMLLGVSAVRLGASEPTDDGGVVGLVNPHCAFCGSAMIVKALPPPAPRACTDPHEAHCVACGRTAIGTFTVPIRSQQTTDEEWMDSPYRSRIRVDTKERG